MIRAAAGVLAVVAAACSVPGVNLDGKNCPCVDGYTCQVATNTCVRDTAGDAGPDDDGAVTDVPSERISGTSCLSGTVGAEIYHTDFNDSTGWSFAGSGNWVAMGGELHQTNANASLSYGWRPAINQANYRMVSRMRLISGGVGRAMELSARTQNGTSEQYHCNFEPIGGAFLIMWTGDVGQTDYIELSTLDTGSYPGYSPTMDFTMEFEVNETTLSCCIQEFGVASRIVSVDTRLASGSPGMKTYQVSGAYDYLTVYTLQ